jgi:CubicO group peptidase (beta-lactamase class C family)
MLKMITFIIALFLFSCTIDDGITETPQQGEAYFPTVGSSQWATITPESLGWNKEKIPELKKLLEKNGTRAFLVIKDGKIVIEEYFGRDLLKISKFTKDKQWYWASAGKTLTAFTVGKAQEDGYLSISDKTSDYLGKGWTSLPAGKEELITIRNQLTMTSGLDDGAANEYAFSPTDLIYEADAGTRWAYHNGPYTLLENVVSKATGKSFDTYFNEKLAAKIGMDGQWRWMGNFHIYFSTARSMARFGLLMLNKGVWNGEVIMKDADFYHAMINPSQDINKSYGYLWWLNGKESYMLPQTQKVFNGSITPNAPTDMYSGLGKNGQYLSVVPSLNLVMVRMGENPDQSMVAAMFQRDIWEKLNAVMNRQP